LDDRGLCNDTDGHQQDLGMGRYWDHPQYYDLSPGKPTFHLSSSRIIIISKFIILLWHSENREYVLGKDGYGMLPDPLQYFPNPRIPRLHFGLMPSALDLALPHRSFSKEHFNEHMSCIGNTSTRTISYPTTTTINLIYGIVEEVSGLGLLSRQ